MNKQLIEKHYELQVSDLTPLDSHFGTEILRADTSVGKYIVKVLPLYVEDVDNEGFITEYLYNHGLKVARLLKSKAGAYVVKMKDFQFTIQEYIEGETLAINTAPQWFMRKLISVMTGRSSFSCSVSAPIL